MAYSIRLDFAGADDPPHVFIADGDGAEVIEMLEDPIQLSPAWSDEETDWQVGPLTQRVLQLLNES